MKEVFLLEMHPTKNEYFKEVAGEQINTTKHIEEAHHMDSYDIAMKQLRYLLFNDFNCLYVPYYSIVKYFVKG
jgi:hypothetical protein